MRHRGLLRKHRKTHRVDITKERGQGGGCLRNSSEFHIFCGDRVTAARDVPSPPAGGGEEAAVSVFVTSPTHGSKSPPFTTRRACVFACVRPYKIEHSDALL